jgi:hypothetical protein
MREGDNSGITSKQISANVRESSYSKVKGTNPNGNPVDGTDVYDKQ